MWAVQLHSYIQSFINIISLAKWQLQGNKQTVINVLSITIQKFKTIIRRGGQRKFPRGGGI